MRILIILFIFGCLLSLFSVINDWRVERQHPPIGSFINVDGQKLHYWDSDQQKVLESQITRSQTGPVLVLIHGASGNLLDMKLALGDELARSHRVIIFDRPGRGYSQRPKDGHLLAVQAKLVHDALQKMNVTKPLMVGQSLGGAFSLSYALNYQQDLSGLVLLAPVSHEWPGDVVWYNRASNKPIIGFILRRMIVPIYGQLVAGSGVDGTFWPLSAPQDYADKTGLGLLFRPKDFKSNAADIKNLKSQIVPMSKRYDEIKLPMHIFVGTHDTTVSPTIHSYTLSNEVEDAELTILPRHGHGLHHSAKTDIINGIEDMVDDMIIAKKNITDGELVIESNPPVQ